MKYSFPHYGSVHDIGLDKFFVHYWSTSQMYVYKTQSKQHSSVIAFDATGSLVKKLKRPQGVSGHIFLYEGVLIPGNTEEAMKVPVVQMLSEKHDINAIAYWLTEWKRAGAPLPKETVCDFSMALLGAIVRAFTPYPDLVTYINQCFGVLMEKESSKLPPCFVRVDVAHCIKLVTRWECLRKKVKRVKEFYIRAVAQLITSVSLTDAKDLIKAIFIVALSEAEGCDEMGKTLMSESSKVFLKKRIAEGCVALPAEEFEDETDIPEPKEKLDACSTDLKQWVVNLRDECKLLAADNGDRDNLHFLPAIVPHITRLCCYLPLWTGVLVPFFKTFNVTASSASVEAEFKNLKHSVLKHETLPMRVDKFLIHHLSFIEGRMRISAARDNVSQMFPPTVCDDTVKAETGPASKESIYPADDKVVENWRGLAIPPKKRRSTYLSPCTEWLHADTSVLTKKAKLGLIRNGNIRDLQPVKVCGHTVRVTNTCAFDAFCQCLCSAFCDSTFYSSYV